MDLSDYKIISLSHVIDEDIPRWPGDPRVRLETIATFDESGFFLRKVSIGEHSATHLNAPLSFFPHGADISAIKPAILPLIVADVCQEVADDSNYRFTLEAFNRFESRHDPIFEGCFFALHTGWDRFWKQPTFLGLDAKNHLHFPAFDPAVIDVLLARKVAGVGIDTHGIDAPDDALFTAQKHVLLAKGLVIECMANLGQLPSTGAWILVAPLRLQGGSGSPVAPVALFPKNVKHF